MSIRTIRLEDHESTSPPNQILDMTIIDGLIFLDIKQFSEGFESDYSEIIVGDNPFSEEHEKTYANRAGMAFHLNDFVDAITTLYRADLRNTQRLQS